MPLKSIPAHGRAFVFRTAIGGGLAVRVTYTDQAGKLTAGSVSAVKSVPKHKREDFPSQSKPEKETPSR